MSVDIILGMMFGTLFGWIANILVGIAGVAVGGILMNLLGQVA